MSLFNCLFVKYDLLAYNLVMYRLVYVLIVISLICVPAWCEQKPSVLNTDIKEDIKQSSLTDLREQMRLYYNTNNLSSCMDILSKIPDAEKNAEDWLLMSNIALDNNKSMDAFLYLQRSLLADSKFYKAYYNLGNIHFENGNINLAMDSYRKAIKYKEDFSYAYYNLGCCYLKKKNYRLARYYFANAIKYNSQEPTFYYNIAYTYKMLKNEKRAREALTFYEELMSK